MNRNDANIDDKESRLTQLLFNNKKDLVDKFKTDIGNHNELSQRPAWMDEDDEEFNAQVTSDTNSKKLYSDKLKQKFEILMGTPSWAKLNKRPKIDEDINDEIVRTVGHLKKIKTSGLKKDIIEYKKFPRINSETTNEGPIISCVEFHPKASVALVAGESGVISLFSVGRDVNKKLHSFKLNKWKVTSACFTPDGCKVFLASILHHMYCVYDLMKADYKLIQLPNIMKKAFIFQMSPNGKYLASTDGFDEVYIICSVSKELLRSFKHNTNIKAVTFTHDSEKIFCFGIHGEVTMWDLLTFRPLKKFYDQGCVTAACIANSACGRLVATGSSEGIVNIYETSSLIDYQATPIKTISNLTTKITNLNFNATTEILAISSSYYPNAVKLVHIPSYHVFSNFPKPSLDLFNVNTVNFSPNSGYMGLGNNKGCALLYRLKHYKNY